MAEWRFSSHLINDEITTRGYRAEASVECTTIMVAMFTVMNGLKSSHD
jgi:hypothetical protein